MYTKLYRSMYDGSLGTHGPWQAMVTFQQLLILADRAGLVNMTPEIISRTSTIPLEIINIGLVALAQPDALSQSKLENGRRIVPIDPERSWGWEIVNYGYYRDLRSAEERREYFRVAKQAQRARDAVKSVKNVSRVHPSYSVSYSDSNSDSETTNSNSNRNENERIASSSANPAKVAALVDPATRTAFSDHGRRLNGPPCPPTGPQTADPLGSVVSPAPQGGDRAGGLPDAPDNPRSEPAKFAALSEPAQLAYHVRCVVALNHGLKNNPHITAPRECSASEQRAVVTWEADGIPIDLVERVVRERAASYQPVGRSRQPHSLKYFDASVRSAHEAAQLPGAEDQWARVTRELEEKYAAQ